MVGFKLLSIVLIAAIVLIIIFNREDKKLVTSVPDKNILPARPITPLKDYRVVRPIEPQETREVVTQPDTAAIELQDPIPPPPPPAANQDAEYMPDPRFYGGTIFE